MHRFHWSHRKLTNDDDTKFEAFSKNFKDIATFVQTESLTMFCLLWQNKVIKDYSPHNHTSEIKSSASKKKAFLRYKLVIIIHRNALVATTGLLLIFRGFEEKTRWRVGGPGSWMTRAFGRYFDLATAWLAELYRCYVGVYNGTPFRFTRLWAHRRIRMYKCNPFVS